MFLVSSVSSSKEGSLTKKAFLALLGVQDRSSLGFKRIRHSASMSATTPLLQVAQGLYLGNELQAASHLLLLEHNVRSLVNAAGNQVGNHFADFGCNYLPLDLYDTLDDDIHQYFQPTFEFIGTSICSSTSR